MVGTSSELADLVQRTVVALNGARLPLEMPGSRELNELRSRLITQLSTRILPHLVSESLPAVVVLGGSSGAGKSTIFNTLVGEEVSPASVLRPTTRQAVIGIHPSDEGAMRGHALLEMGRPVIMENAIPGIVIIDAPDLDSVEAANRELSHRLLDAADLWVFVTTASRYGDALAWQTLTGAYRRGMTTAVVLNRVSEKAVRAVSQDLRTRMIEEQIGDTPLLVVPDVGPHEGVLPRDAVSSVYSWLTVMAQSHVGATLAERTTRATLPEIRRGLLDLAEAVEHQANAVQDLLDQASAATAEALGKLTTNALNGRFGQGAPTATWLTASSTGGPLESLAHGEKPRLGARRAIGARDAAATSVFDSVQAAIRVAVRQGILSAGEAIESSWSRDAVATEDFRAQGRSAVVPQEIEDRVIAGWKKDLMSLVPSSVQNPWLGAPGMAALVGAAAGGVSGCERSLHVLGVSHALRPARDALAARCENAIGEVIGAYQSAVQDVRIGNGRQLRLRASEYLDRM